MRFALIGADNAWLSGPLDAAPVASDGQRVVEVAIGYPSTCLWSQERGGFVDVAGPATLMTVGRFKLLFAQSERMAIHAAAATVPAVYDYLDLLAGFTSGLAIDDPFLVASIGELVAADLLTAERAATILAGVQPA